jgi:hypothetical protein
VGQCLVVFIVHGHSFTRCFPFCVQAF